MLQVEISQTMRKWLWVILNKKICDKKKIYNYERRINELQIKEYYETILSSCDFRSLQVATLRSLRFYDFTTLRLYDFTIFN